MSEAECLSEQYDGESEAERISQEFRTAVYNVTKRALVGARVQCPFCGNTFRKKNRSHTFCRRKCKDSFWNRTADRIERSKEWSAKY